MLGYFQQKGELRRRKYIWTCFMEPRLAEVAFVAAHRNRVALLERSGAVLCQTHCDFIISRQKLRACYQRYKARDLYRWAAC